MIKLDAKGKSLGRIASEVALFLQGKNSPSWRRHMPGKEKVVVINSDHLLITGKKREQKKYYHHSGYLGGLKTIAFKVLFEKDSKEVLRKAIYGMLPKNKLRANIIKNLKLYHGEEK